MHWKLIEQWKSLQFLSPNEKKMEESSSTLVINNKESNGNGIGLNYHQTNGHNGHTVVSVTQSPKDYKEIQQAESSGCSSSYSSSNARIIKYPGNSHSPSQPATEDEAESIQSTLEEDDLKERTKTDTLLNVDVEFLVEEDKYYPDILTIPNKRYPGIYSGPGENLEDKWRVLFDKFDPEGFGEIPWPDFIIALKSEEFKRIIPHGKILLFEDLAMTTNQSKLTNAITFQYFVNIMSGKRSRSFKCAVHHRDREVSSENDFHLLPPEYRDPPGVKRMARLIADEFLTDERDRKYYADHYRCLPPPLFIISVTLIELGFFTYYTLWHGEISSSGPLPMDSPFVYRPDKRQEVWRFLCYMVLHAGWVHLMFNLLVQLLVGLPLEMVHGSVRIGCVYMAGVLAGSLGTSVFDPDVYLVGASGGVYALLAAHLANVLLNYNNMEFGILRLLGVFLIASVDVGFAIYDRYAASTLTEGTAAPVSYVAHLTGALAGLTIGLLVLKNFEQRLREQLMWWCALGVYGACTLFAILFNIFHRFNYPEMISTEFIDVSEKFPHPNSGIISLND